MFQRLDFMEKRGSGFIKIINAVQKIDNMKFYSNRSWFRATFKSMKNASVKLNKTQSKILEYINKSNEITTIELANKLNKNQSTIVRNINILKHLNMLQRIGSDKTGYWQVL